MPLHVYVCMYCACACVSIKYVDLEVIDFCFGCMELGVLHWDIHTYVLTYMHFDILKYIPMYVHPVAQFYIFH